ncbi:hypothetical protein J1614_004521 [Plenodomus biglobosus]|nr:hypothetical protein J1614_004521 [Plenodomus biglobosus]
MQYNSTAQITAGLWGYKVFCRSEHVGFLFEAGSERVRVLKTHAHEKAGLKRATQTSRMLCGEDSKEKGAHLSEDVSASAGGRDPTGTLDCGRYLLCYNSECGLDTNGMQATKHVQSCAYNWLPWDGGLGLEMAAVQSEADRMQLRGRKREASSDSGTCTYLTTQT